MFETEMEVFDNNRSKYIEEYPDGGFLVIKCNEILGIWNDRQDAIREGIKKYGYVSFLVKNIIPRNHAFYFSRDLNFA